MLSPTNEPAVDSIGADLAAIDRVKAVPTILEVVCRVTGMGFAAVARVTDRRWVACAVRDEIGFGLKPGGELTLETTICHEIRQSGEPVAIDHVAEDPHYRAHRTPALYGFQSYISVPIVLPDGSFFGTLCAIDPRPARLRTPEATGMFKLFAELIAFHLDAGERLARSEASLTDERLTAELREQFIAVLGHDLRNPLASIDAGTKLLGREPQSDKARMVLGLLQASVARMTGMIDNLLDFARGRLGGDIGVERRDAVHLEPVLSQVIDELQAAHPGRAVAASLTLPHAVRCDPLRIGQLMSNLLGNALAHGADDGAIRVRAVTDGRAFELTVANPGEPIPPDAIERLFQPFYRVNGHPGRKGLGLGLYIANEIARAHGGTIDVRSDAEETRFTFRMPAA